MPSTCAAVAEPAEALSADFSDSATAVFIGAAVSVPAVSAVAVSLAVLVSLQATNVNVSAREQNGIKSLFMEPPLKRGDPRLRGDDKKIRNSIPFCERCIYLLGYE